MVQLTQSCSAAITMPVGSSPTLSGCGSSSGSVIVRRHYESRPGRTLSGYSYGNHTPTRYRPSFDTGSHRPRHDRYLWRENNYAPLGTITRRAFASPTGSKSTTIAHTLPYGQQQVISSCTLPNITMDVEHILGLSFEVITLRISVKTLQPSNFVRFIHATVITGHW